MTGSSSATALHVLYGINDVGIGTDGGGSVLAPALSLGLYSVMGKGMGLSGRMLRQSTDGIAFTPGLGVISHSFHLAAETALIMVNDDSNIETISLSGMKMAIPSVDCVRLPDGSNMRERLVPAIGIIQGLGIGVCEADFPDCMDRCKSIAWAESMLTDHHFIMTYEGPIDFYGLGDSVYGAWGYTSTKNQAISGKYMVKIANMINATAITIPLGDAASGIVVLSRPGIECGLAVIALGLKLAAAFPTPAIFDDFFHSGWERRKNELLFSLQEEK